MSARTEAETAERRDRDVHYASQQLTEWRRAMGSRQRSQPSMAHIFDDH